MVQVARCDEASDCKHGLEKSEMRKLIADILRGKNSVL